MCSFQVFLVLFLCVIVHFTGRRRTYIKLCRRQTSLGGLSITDPSFQKNSSFWSTAILRTLNDTSQFFFWPVLILYQYPNNTFPSPQPWDVDQSTIRHKKQTTENNINTVSAKSEFEYLLPNLPVQRG